jgi:hypothetical protein
MEFGEVAQFLHPSAGPVIIIPAEIVAKSGTDFDVDKMTTYMPFLTRSGKLMEKMNEEDIDEKEEELKTKFDKLVLNKKVIEVLKQDKSEKWLDINFKLNNFRKAIRLAGKKIDEKTLETLSSNKSKVIIKAMDEPGMEEYVKNFIPKAYNIYIKNIKGVTLENLETVEYALEIIYNEKSELSEVFTERADLNDHKNNMLGGIQNKLIQDMVNILELPHLAASLMSPNDTNLAKPAADKLEGYIQKADNESDYTVSVKTGKKMYKRGISPTKVYTQNYNIKRHQENFSSKDSLGIAAIDNYINNLLNMAGGIMEKSMNVSAKTPIKTKEGFKWPKDNNTTVEVNIDLNLPHNKLNGAISLSHVMDKLKTNSIADIINQLMNGFVDVGKDAWVAYLQGNVDVVPKFLFLLQTGVPFKHIAYLVSNPMTRQYIKDKANGKAVLSPLLPGIAKSYDVAGNMLKKIGFSENVIENLNNIYGIQEALKEKAKSSDFTEEALERVAQKSLDYTDREQIAGFLEYLYVENLIEDYDAMKKAMNPDTKNSPDLYSAQAKIEEVQGLMNNPSISEPVINKLATNSIISPFFIQEFARRLFSRLFKLRDDSQVNNFLISIFKDRMNASKAKKITGYDTETYIAKFKNFIAQYIFANELRVYKSGDTVYKGMPITPEVLEQLNQDFDKGLYLRSNNNSNSYESRKLAPISAQAFPGIVKKDSNNNPIVVPNEKLRTDFIEFGLERDYLRQTMSLESVKNTKEFETRRKRLMASGYSEYRQNDGESAEEYMDRLNSSTYEDMLANKALTNTYNIWQLFRSGDNTIAQELTDIITNYPEMGKSTKYSMLLQFMPLGIPNDVLYKNISNFMLKNYSNLDEGLISEYNNQWNDLANPNKDKVIANKEANIYISNFFQNLPLYAFLQSGMDSGKFSLASVMPYNEYKKVMDKASEKFIAKLETTDSDKILQGLKQLFEIENSGKNKKLRGRGPLLKVDISNLPDAEYSIYEQPFIERVMNDNNIPIGVFNITNNYTKDGRAYPVTRDQVGKLIENNPSVIFLLSPADLIKLTNVLTTDEINKAKININDAINKIISTGTDVVVYSEGFGDSAKKFFDNNGIAEAPKKQVTTEYPIEPGRFVTNSGVTYITIKKNDNGTWQVYNPKATGANSKKSFAESNLTTSFIKAVKVRYRDADYLVTPKDTIISLTTGTKMEWKDNDGNRIAILKLKDTKPVTNEPVSVPTNQSSKTGVKAPVTNEVKGSIQLQLIEDLVQQGKAKTTVRRYDKESGIYKSEAGNLYNLVNRGKVRMVGDKIIGKGIAYTLDEFGAAEGFDNWAGFVKAAKYAGIDIQAGKEVFLYDITPAGKAADKVRPVFDSLPSKSSTPTMTYAGIGSRETPQEVLDKMTEVAKYLDGLGYTLNTGKTFTAKPSNDPKYQKQYEERLAFSKKNNGKVGLDEEGADRAFSLGTTKKNLFGVNAPVGKKEMSVMEEIHPSPDRLKEGGKKLMARNTNQIFGENLNTPVDFVLFYAKETKGIRPEGGTGQAVEMARRKGIPTINMADTNWKQQLKAAIANKATTQPSISVEKFSYARTSDNSYEVSTAGDSRFSALNAKLKDGRTIEEAYQLDVKGYRTYKPGEKVDARTAGEFTGEDKNGKEIILDASKATIVREDTQDPSSVYINIQGEEYSVSKREIIPINPTDKNWKKGKGKKPLHGYSEEDNYLFYKDLWSQWIKENPSLLEDLKQKAKGKVLTDKFASSPVSQARALADILNETIPTTQPSTSVKSIPEQVAEGSSPYRSTFTQGSSFSLTGSTSYIEADVTLNQAIDKAINESKNPEHISILKSYLKLLDKNILGRNIFLSRDRYIDNSTGNMGVSLATEFIGIRRTDKEGGLTDRQIQTIVHELTHMLTLQPFIKESDKVELTIKEKEFLKEIRSLYEYVKTLPESKNKDFYNAISNEYEFIADAIADPNFRKFLNSIEYQKGKTVLSKLISFVKNLLGVKAGSALETVIDQVYSLREDSNFKHYDTLHHSIDDLKILKNSGFLKKSSLDFKTISEFTTERKREILSNFAAKHKLTEQKAYDYINEALNDKTKNPTDIINKLKECY